MRSLRSPSTQTVLLTPICSLTQADEDELTGFVSHKIPSYSALPVNTNPLYMSCNIMLNIAFLWRLNGTRYSILLHLFRHVCILCHSPLITHGYL
uniref:Uncharacterized protein n=1 Tax=Otus sunia TaxID=257818 RepID=A0A8C8ADK4_9STRI